jgi:hypothetical protein
MMVSGKVTSSVSKIYKNTKNKKVGEK